MSARRTTAILAATAAALTMTVTLGGNAGAVVATTQHDVRQSDFVAALSDTRAAGHDEFLKEGLEVWTDGSADTGLRTDGGSGTWNTDKVAEYFKVSGGLPSSISLSWRGTDAQPGTQTVFSSGTAGDSGYNILVGEPVYNGDYWLSTGSWIYKNHHELCPETSGGFGSDCHGTLPEWQAKFPNATVTAAGFSLGSGVKGSGLARSITLDHDEYVFTDVVAASTGGTQVAAPVAVTGTATHRSYGRNTRVTLTSDALPTGATEAAKLQWKILTGPRGGTLHVRLSDSMGAGETLGWGFTFPAHQSPREVRILKNGVVVADYTVR